MSAVLDIPARAESAPQAWTPASLGAALLALAGLLTLLGLAAGSEGWSFAWAQEWDLVSAIRAPRTLGALLHRPTVLPLPGFLARAGLGGEMATELLLQGQLVTPTALLDAGFVFDDAELRAALTRALAK